MKTYKIYFDFDDLKEKTIDAHNLVKALDALHIPYCSVVRVRENGKLLSDEQLDDAMSIFNPLDEIYEKKNNMICDMTDRAINELFKSVGLSGDLTPFQNEEVLIAKEKLNKVLTEIYFQLT